MQPRHEVIRTETPAAVTLRIMGQTAERASNRWTFREWAARLAAEAGARDYVGQLHRLYDEILQRWRYVREPDEWIHGTPASLISHVLGTKYNAPGQDPERIDLATVPTTHKGWGDCDDIATVVAAAARAIGLTPFFRVVRGPAGAHVSTLVRLPTGQFVSVDPVGHPEHPFGWAMESDDVQLFDLAGSHLPHTAQGPAFGAVEAMTFPTVYSNYMGQPEYGAQRGHLAATHAGDARGPRALALPARMHKLFRHGVVIDGCPAFDENGNAYTYDANRDLWLADKLQQTRLGNIDDSLGGVRRRRRKARRRKKGGRQARRARRKRRRATIRRAVKRVVRPLRKIQARISKSKLVQAGASAALGVFGIPPHLTRGVLEASGELFERGGIPAVVRLLRKDPKAAARLVAQAAKAGVKRGVRGGVLSAFAGDIDQPRQYMAQQGGRQFYVQPIVALAGVPGLYEFGALEVSLDPLPGTWYRIQRGDYLLKVAERAWGDRGTRLKHSKWINAANANAVYYRPTDSAFERNQYGENIISFNPNFSEDAGAATKGEGGNAYAVIWIPEAPGDEPPADIPDVVIPDVVEPDIPPVEPEDDVIPDTPDIPPVDDVIPVEPDIDIIPDVDIPALPTEREKCEEAGGTFVPTETGYACVTCPQGQRWDFFQRMCVPIEPVTPEIPEIPSCPTGTYWDPAAQTCVPDVVEPDIIPDIPDVVIPDLPDLPDLIPDIPDVVIPEVEPDTGVPSTGTPPLLMMGLAYLLLGGDF